MKENDDIYVTYLNKEYVDSATYSLFEQGTLDPEDSFVIIENLDNGIYLPPDDYDDITIYSTKDEIEEKIKSCKVYDSVHIRFFDIDLDEIKNKYSAIASKENITLVFFEKSETGNYCTTFPLCSEDIMDMTDEEWETKKNKLINAIQKSTEDVSSEFKADYSFKLNKSKKKMSIEFDENKRLYRLKTNFTSDLIFDEPEVKNMIEILEFFIDKSED